MVSPVDTPSCRRRCQAPCVAYSGAITIGHLRASATLDRESSLSRTEACRLRTGSRYRSGRSPDWLKFKNPEAVNLQVGKAHLDAFALVARLEEGLCPHQPACHVAGIFMNIAGNLTRRAIGTALHLKCTDFAVELGCAIAKRLAVVHGAGGVQHLAAWADVNTSPPVPAKVSARECAVVAKRLGAQRFHPQPARAPQRRGSL